MSLNDVINETIRNISEVTRIIEDYLNNSSALYRTGVRIDTEYGASWIPDVLPIIYIIYSVFLMAAILVLFSFVKYSRAALHGYERRHEGPRHCGEPRFISFIIPIRNEAEETLISAVKRFALLDYPKDLYEVIVVSDDDEARAKRLKLLSEWYARLYGITLRFVRREKPVGFKGGALNFAAEIAEGDLLVFLDVDSRFGPDVAWRIACNSTDKGAVFLGWSGYSPLPTMLGRLLELSYRVFLEKMAILGRYLHDKPIMLLGSGFALSRNFLRSIGGFCHCVADDYELSTRIFLRGGHIRYVPGAPVYVEIPGTYGAFKSQYARWVFNSAWVLRRYVRDIVKLPWPLTHKVDLLSNFLQHPLISINALTLLLGTLLAFMGVVIPPLPVLLLQAMALLFALMVAYYATLLGSRDLGEGKIRVLGNLGRLAALSVLVSFTCLVYTLKGLVSDRLSWRTTPKGKAQLTVGERPRLEAIVLLAYAALLGMGVTSGNAPLVLNAVGTIALLSYGLRIAYG